MQHAEGRKSIVHNHPPQREKYVYPAYRRATRSEEMYARLLEIWPLCQGAKQAKSMIEKEFPGSQWTRQDVVNAYRKYQQRAEKGKEGEDEGEGEKLLNQCEQEEYQYP